MMKNTLFKKLTLWLGLISLGLSFHLAHAATNLDTEIKVPVYTEIKVPVSRVGSPAIEGNRIAMVVNPGELYIFDFDGTDWKKTAKLVDKHGEDFGRWDISIALAGNRLAVGAPRVNAAYVFDLSGAVSTWQDSQQKFTVGDETHLDYFSRTVYFGEAVSLDGNHLAVGVGRTRNPTTYSNKGAVYVYDLSGAASTWQDSQQKLFITDTGYDASVSLDGNRMAVGYPRANIDGNSSQQGAVYLFDFDGTDWKETTKLVAGDGRENDLFGTSISLDGNRLAVGALADIDGINNLGATYVFDFNGTDWKETTKLAPSTDGKGRRTHGYQLALDGNYLAVNGYHWDDILGKRAYGVHLFDLSGDPTSWSTSYESLDVFSYWSGADSFGRLLALDDNRLVVGWTPNLITDDKGNETLDGAAFYVYDDITNPPSSSASYTLGGNISGLNGSLVLQVNGANDLPVTTNGRFAFPNPIAGRYHVTISSLPTGQTCHISNPTGRATANITDILITCSKPEVIDLKKGYNIGDREMRTAFSPGKSLALDGTRMALSPEGWQSPIFIYDFDGSHWQLTAELTPNYSGGYSGKPDEEIALAGNRLVVGNARATVNGNSDQGAVHVFDLSSADPTTWNDSQYKLTAGDGGEEHYFGSSLALEGNRLFVLSRGTGTVYAFDLSSADPTTWNNSPYKLTTVDDGNENFVRIYAGSMAVNGNRLAVGVGKTMSADDGERRLAGAVYLFDLSSTDPTTWNNSKHKLTFSNGRKFFDFGLSLALAGHRLAVGDATSWYPPGGESTNEHVGTVHLFDLSSTDKTTWKDTRQTLSALPYSEDNNFGYSLALSGNQLAVGRSLSRPLRSVHVSDALPDVSAAYVFDLSCGVATWDNHITLAPNSYASGKVYFGETLAFSGNQLAVNSLRGDQETGPEGQMLNGAYVYHLTPSTIGGQVSGLNGNLVLQNNTCDDLTIKANGKFTFINPVIVTKNYAVRIKTQPAGQTCTVAQGSGTASDDITDVMVSCIDNAPTTFNIGGQVSGLNGKVTLQNNQGDNLTLTADGPFTFTTPVAGAYAVSVSAQPTGQICTVARGSGTAGGNITNVTVSCTDKAPTTFSIGGHLSGLNGKVTLQNNQGDNLTLTADGPFTFTTPVAGAYDVSVSAQPTGQTCTVARGRGTAVGNITNVTVSCRQVQPVTTYALGVTVNGLDQALSRRSGQWQPRRLPEALVLQNNGGDDLTITRDGVYTFSQRLLAGAGYHVTIKSTPRQTVCQLGTPPQGQIGQGEQEDQTPRMLTVNCRALTGQIPSTVRPVPTLGPMGLLLLISLMLGLSAWKTTRQDKT